MTVEYRVWESRFRDWTDPMGYWSARRKMRKWLDNRQPPFMVEDRRVATVNAALDRLGTLMKKAEVGDVLGVRTTNGNWRAMVRKVEVDTAGDIVVQAALSQLGVDYVWAAEDPGDGFDCSGLTKWAYAQVDVTLPHSAEQQRLLVNTFQSNSFVKPGDLVFYHVGRLPAGQADHVGIAVNKREVCDASSGLDRVVRRAIDSNPIMSYGRVVSVNGPVG